MEEMGRMGHPEHLSRYGSASSARLTAAKMCGDDMLVSEAWVRACETDGRAPAALALALNKRLQQECEGTLPPCRAHTRHYTQHAHTRRGPTHMTGRHMRITMHSARTDNRRATIGLPCDRTATRKVDRDDDDNGKQPNATDEGQ